MSMASTPLELTTEIPIFSSKESMFTTMKLQVSRYKNLVVDLVWNCLLFTVSLCVAVVLKMQDQRLNG